MIIDEEKVETNFLLTGTHDGELMGKKPTWKKIKACVMNKEGTIYKDVNAKGVIGIMKPLDLC